MAQPWSLPILYINNKFETKKRSYYSIVALEYFKVHKSRYKAVLLIKSTTKKTKDYIWYYYQKLTQ
jgi:hypothetical protein